MKDNVPKTISLQENFDAAESNCLRGDADRFRQQKSMIVTRQQK